VTSAADPFHHVKALEELADFRLNLNDCLTVRSDTLFELVEALSCMPGPVKALVGLALAPEMRRGYGGLYHGINAGRIELARLSMLVAGLPLPRAGDGRIVPAADVSNWLRPDAACCPERLFCHVSGPGKGNAQTVSALTEFVL
jgi:hypothetical protein